MTHPSASTHVAVIGAGTMGAWTALAARRAGTAATLIDAFGAGNPRSTSGDESRILRSAHGDDRLYPAWSRRAREAWLAFDEEVGETFLLPTGALWLAHRDGGFEAASEAAMRSLGIPVERLMPAEAAERWPAMVTDDLAFVVHEPEAGLLLARQAIAAVARRFADLGGRRELAWAVPGRVEGRRLLDVALGDGGRIPADEFVFAAGPWLPRLFPGLLGDRIRVTKQDVVFVGPDAGDGRFGPDRLPCWVDYDAAFYGLPAIEGGGMKLAPDRYGPVFDPSHGERIVDPESVRLARRYLARRFPAIADGPIIQTRVCQYETTPDTHFILDRHPDFDNVWIAGGGSGHGFKHGPVIGEYLLARMAGAAPTDDEARFGLGHERISKPNMRTGADGMVEGWSDW